MSVRNHRPGHDTAGRTSVVILRIDTVQEVQPTPPAQPARTTVRGAAAVALYADLLLIPQAASGDEAVACPADFGVVYRLTFMAGAKVVAQATAQGAGCRAVTVLPSTTLKRHESPGRRVLARAGAC